jgi:hypothetical protein
LQHKAPVKNEQQALNSAALIVYNMGQEATRSEKGSAMNLIERTGTLVTTPSKTTILPDCGESFCNRPFY